MKKFLLIAIFLCASHMSSIAQTTDATSNQIIAFILQAEANRDNLRDNLHFPNAALQVEKQIQELVKELEDRNTGQQWDDVHKTLVPKTNEGQP